MTSSARRLIFMLAASAFALEAAASEKSGVTKRTDGKPGEIQASALWNYPADISSRNLYYGPGGRRDEPRGPYVFIREDLDGTNPKFDIRDRNQVEWKVKLGMEARPETAASRLVWAVGYFTNEDYFLPELKVEKMPAHLHRGQKLITPFGVVHNARLKRHIRNEKKIGVWRWRDNPFSDSREINGLRVMMALINNWDLKDENNAIYKIKNPGETSGSREIYMVSDLGSSFGTTGIAWPLSKSKGDLRSYSQSKFIRRFGRDDIDFSAPARPAFYYLLALPQYVHRLHLRWLGRNIPLSDAMWIGHLLARLSPDQVRDAFGAAGCTPQESDSFARIVLTRIAELNTHENFLMQDR